MYEDLLRKRFKISSVESCRSACAKSVYEDLLCKMSVSRSPRILYDHLCRISVCGSLVQDLSVMMSASGASRATCVRCLYAGLLSKIGLSWSLRQDLVVGPLVQDLCMRISCARCLRSPQQNPVGALVQDRCMRISCARCLCQDLLGSCRSTCARSVCADLLCKISLSWCLRQDPVGPLVQDLCM